MRVELMADQSTKWVSMRILTLPHPSTLLARLRESHRNRLVCRNEDGETSRRPVLSLASGLQSQPPESFSAPWSVQPFLLAAPASPVRKAGFLPRTSSLQSSRPHRC